MTTARMICGLVFRALLTPSLAGALAVDSIAGEDPAAPLRSGAAAMAGDLSSLEAVYREVLGQVHGERPALVLRLELQRAVLAKPMNLELTQSPVVGLRGLAWATTVNRELHGVTSSKLSIEGTAAQGKVTGTVDIRIGKSPSRDSLEQDFFGGHPWIPATVSVDLAMKDGTVTGKYSLKPGVMPAPPTPAGREKIPPPPNPLSASAGTVSGRAVSEAVIPAPEGRPEMIRASDDATYCYGTACRIETAAENVYAELRAAAFMRDEGLSLEAATRNVLVPRAVRPSLQAPAGGGAAAKPKPAGDDISSDLMDVPDDIAAAQARRKGGGDAGKVIGEMAAEMSDMTHRMAMLAAIAKWYLAAGRKMPEFATGTVETGDDEFGPWYGEGILAVSNGVNYLPKVTADGKQEWQAVWDWKSIGPFRVTSFTNHTPYLPTVVMSTSTLIRIEGEGLLRGGAYKGPNPAGWQGVQAPGAVYTGLGKHFGVLGPPNWSGANRVYLGCSPMLGGHPRSGLEDSTTFMKADIVSEVDQEVWVGLGVNERAQFWLNDEPCWVSPAHHPVDYIEYVGLQKMKFRKGMNRVVVRLDVDYSSPFLWMRVCLSGSPRSAEEVKAKAAAVAAKRAEIPPSGVVGWRGDGNGIYPGSSRPPLAWNPKSGHNVLWRVPLEYWSNGTPVPVPGTNKVFITQNPHWLICLDKDTGRELWRRAVSFLEMLPEAEKKEGYRLLDAWMAAEKKRNAIPANWLRPEKWWRDSWYWAEGTGAYKWLPPPAEKAQSPEMIALQKKRETLEKAEDPTAVMEELAKVNEEIEKLRAKVPAVEADSAEAGRAEFRRHHDAFFKFLQKYCPTGPSGGYWPDYCGNVFPTPLTDGTSVWMRADMDVLACYDLDGKPRWMIRTYDANGADQNMSSPRLADGKIIMQMRPTLDAEEKGEMAWKGGKKTGTIMFRAYDAATGRKLWSTPIRPTDWNDSTPLIATLTDGRDVMKVVVSSAGAVVRVADGKTLVSDLGLYNGFTSLVAQDDVAVFSEITLSPVRLLMKDRDTVGFQRFFALDAGDGYGGYGGIVVKDGLTVSAATVGPSGGGHGQGSIVAGPRASNGPNEVNTGLEFRDLRTGKVVAGLHTLRKGGHQYQPPFVAGGHVYSVMGDSIFISVHPKPPLWVCVTTGGPKPLHLANSVIDRTMGSGAADGGRIYFTGHNYAMCVAYTGDEGKAYEARAIARNLLDKMQPQRPKATDVDPVSVAMIREDRLMAGGGGATLLIDGHAPHSWWAVGPFPAGSEDAALKAIGGPAAPIKGDETVMFNGEKREWGPLSSAKMRVGVRDWELDPANFSDIHRQRRAVDLATATGRREDVVWVLATELNSDTNQIMRFDNELPGSTAWISGKEVRHGDRVAFGKGRCRMVMTVKVGKIPANGLWLSPRFWASDDPKEEESRWLDMAQRCKPYLEDVVRLSPASAEVAEAKRVFEGIAK